MQWSKINADEVVAFHSPKDTSYTSKMLTGDEMAGCPVLNINEGTLEAHARTGGATHEETEIYYMIDVGEGSAVVLDGEPVSVRNGDIIVIPGGTHHWIDNTQCDKPFKLFTLWDRQEFNITYHRRLAAGGKSMRYVRDEQGEEK